MGDVRGLQPPEDVKLRVVTVEWVKENWGESPNEEARKEVKIEETIWKVLFILPEDASLEKIRVRQAGAIIAAVLENEVYVVKENFNPSNRWKAEEIFAHELTHVIQGKYFHLPHPRFHDESQALSALVEGDAGFTAHLFMEALKSPKAKYLLLGLFPQVGALRDPITEIWLFPYTYGETFIKALFDEGGWERVNEAYETPPETTEQILHPEKFLAGEGYERVDALPPNASNWVMVKTDRLGEHVILVMLEAYIPLEEAEEAAYGWGGDNFTLYKKEDGYYFTWNIIWDTEEDASQFVNAFREMMEGLGAEVLEGGKWRVGNEYIALEREGRNTFITGCLNVEE